MFSVLMATSEFDDRQGGLWVEFSQRADDEPGFSARRVETPPPDFTGPRFEAMLSNIARPVTEPSGGVASMEEVPALAERRYALGPEFQAFWMHGTNEPDPAPGEDFTVHGLTTGPLPASWTAQPAPGGALFYTQMVTGQFDDGEGRLWVEFSRQAGAEPGLAVRRVETPPPGFTGPLFQAMGSNIARPVTEPSGRAASLDEVPALAERRYRLGDEFQGFWMHGTTTVDPGPGEDFTVHGLTTGPIQASWNAEPAPGGPLFYTEMVTDQFNDGEGRLWVEFSRQAGDEPGFAVRRVETPPPGFTGPRFQALDSNMAYPSPEYVDYTEETP